MTGVPGLARLLEPQALREYALLADGERGALVGPRGEIGWLCAPGWADGAVFSSLVGGRAVFAVGPTADRHVRDGCYVDGSMVWNTRWITTEGVVECRDALAFPGDPDRTVVLRRIRGVDGPAEVAVTLLPSAEFDRRPVESLHEQDGVWDLTCGDLHLRVTGLPGAAVVRDGPRRGLHRRLVVPPGGHHDVVLEIGETLPPHLVDPDVAWRATTDGWAGEIPRFDAALAGLEARRSYAVLRGLTSSRGGMVAAATTGLPEGARGGDRNYDYRYAWIRDQAYAGQAVAVWGHYALLDRAVEVTADRIAADGPRLRPVYTVGGAPVPPENDLGLPGYPGGADRVGNSAGDQFQLDVWGEALLLFAAAARAGRLTRHARRALDVAVTTIADRWTEPDAGIWELHEDDWTHSRLICAAGLQAVARLGRAGGADTDPEEMQALADLLLHRVNATSRHPSGRWQRTPTDDRVDASLLRPVLREVCPPADPTALATTVEVRRRLAVDGYLYRFRHDEDRLGETEGAFLLCGFDMAMVLQEQNQQVEAVRWFERALAASGAPGLFTEEYDVRQRQLRGNLPQAFVHAAMVESAHQLSRPRVAEAGP